MLESNFFRAISFLRWRSRGIDATAAWSSISGGKDVAEAASEGLGFASSAGSFTLSGLTIGQDYSLMLLSGAIGSGSNTNLAIVGSKTGYNLVLFDGSLGRYSTYNSETSTLAFRVYAGTETSQALKLTFTAAATDLTIKIGVGYFFQAIQGLAIVDTPNLLVWTGAKSGEWSTSVLGNSSQCFRSRCLYPTRRHRNLVRCQERQ